MAKESAGLEGAWLGATLTWVAGFVDAVGYVVLAHVYTANQSGNTVSLGAHLARTEWKQVVFRALPIAAFLPGVLGGILIVEGCRRKRLRAGLAPALMIEAVLLACFMGWSVYLLGNHGKWEGTPMGDFALLIGMSGMAMGLQNGALQQIGALKNVHTYVTGTLVATMESVAAWIWWIWDEIKGPPPRRVGEVFGEAWRHKTFKQAAFSMSLWTGYLAGACVGVLLRKPWGMLCLGVPLGILIVLAVVDLLSPLKRLPADSKGDGG